MTDELLPGHAFLQSVLESIVEDLGELKVESVRDELGILITVSVSDRDMGKLIGKGGQTIKALRILLRLIGGQQNERINLKVLEPATESA